MTESSDKYMPTRARAVQILRDSGVVNPERAVMLMRGAISRLEVDLRGSTVLTEAATGLFACTPVIAALAGADRVLAVTRDSAYGSTEQVIDCTRGLESLCGLNEKIEIFTERLPRLFSEADIITNLGFVRPIDQEAISLLKPGAAITLMCEGWELRPADVDLDACRRRGVLVAATNEDFEGVDVFTYTGLLCLKLLLDAQIEVKGANLTIVSQDKFGQTLSECLTRMGAQVILSAAIHDPELLRRADALIIADYLGTEEIIGWMGQITPDDVLRVAPQLTIVQFCGRVDAHALDERGLAVFPRHCLEAHRMGLTLAGLGPRPVIDLHTAGLKVGQMLRERVAGKQPGRYGSLIQSVGSHAPQLSGNRADKWSVGAQA